MRRAFTAANNRVRCKADITLRDGSGAQCMREAKKNHLCLQHHRIANCPLCKGRGWYLERFSDSHRTACNHPVLKTATEEN